MLKCCYIMFFSGDRVMTVHHQGPLANKTVTKLENAIKVESTRPSEDFINNLVIEAINSWPIHGYPMNIIGSFCWRSPIRPVFVFSFIDRWIVLESRDHSCCYYIIIIMLYHLLIACTHRGRAKNSSTIVFWTNAHLG